MQIAPPLGLAWFYPLRSGEFGLNQETQRERYRETHRELREHMGNMTSSVPRPVSWPEPPGTHPSRFLALSPTPPESPGQVAGLAPSSLYTHPLHGEPPSGSTPARGPGGPATHVLFISLVLPWLAKMLFYVGRALEIRRSKDSCQCGNLLCLLEPAFPFWACFPISNPRALCNSLKTLR